MLYQTLSHTLKLAPHESPSRRTLNNYAIFYAKPSRKTLNNFGKPSTTLIIQNIPDSVFLFRYYENFSSPLYPLCDYKKSSILPCMLIISPSKIEISLWQPSIVATNTASYIVLISPNRFNNSLCPITTVCSFKILC